MLVTRYLLLVILEPINKVSTDFTSPSTGEDKGEGELKGEGSQGGNS